MPKSSIKTDWIFLIQLNICEIQFASYNLIFANPNENPISNFTIIFDNSCVTSKDISLHHQVQNRWTIENSWYPLLPYVELQQLFSLYNKVWFTTASEPLVVPVPGSVGRILQPVAGLSVALADGAIKILYSVSWLPKSSAVS